ncbi:unnamed protein product [Absidia cylindrospora]
MTRTMFDQDQDARHYSTQVARVGVRKGVYVETDVDVRHGLVEAAWIRDYTNQYNKQQQDDGAAFGGIGAVVAFAPVDQGEHVRPYLRLLQRLVGKDLLRGVRYLLQDGGVDMTSANFLEGIRILGEEEFGLLFEMVIDCHRSPEQFPALIQVVAQCPSVSFVLDHMAKPPCHVSSDTAAFTHWATCMQQLASYPNVVACKVSGLITEVENNERLISAHHLGPFVQVAKDAFGMDRLIFGGDWPVCEANGGTWQQWVDVLQEIVQAWEPEEQTRLFVTNAQRCYNLV